MIAVVLRLLAAPLGRALAGGLGVLAVAGGIYVKGRVDGRQACELRVERAVAAEQARQRTANSEALDAARRREEAREIENLALTRKVEDYESELAKRSGDRCVIDADDARRLRDIR